MVWRGSAIGTVVLLVLLAATSSSGRDCRGADGERGSTSGGSTLRFQIAIPKGYNRTYVIDRMRLLYENCTRILGTLVINKLEDGDDASFLSTIEEVYGYVDIYDTSAAIIPLPKLRIIRGQQLLSGVYALSIVNNHIQYFSAPLLRSIEKGNVHIASSANMRCSQKIGWVDMMAGRATPNIASSIETNPCTCDSSCNDKCFMSGPENCYKDTYVGCSAYSCGKRCNLTSQICCHSECAGGCTGYGDTKCVSCAGKRLVLDNGKTRCVSSCPPLTIVDRSTRQEVANPDGRYNHELDCVKSCADVNRLTYKQDCVRTCPLNTEDDDNGVCQPCAPFCKRICFGTDQYARKVLDASYLKNNLTGCTIIDGDLQIGSASFIPDHNHPQAIPLNANNPSELDALLTVQHIKGCLYLDNAHIADVSFLRNVQKIGKCTTSNTAFSIIVIGSLSKVTYLGLSSLRSVQGNAYFQTSNLCYVDTLNRWDNITSNLLDLTTANCTGTVCNSLCSSDGCLGPNPTDCYECKHVSFGGTCFQNCADATLALNETRPVYLDAKTSECRICNSLCFPNGCTGPTNQECLSCPKLKLGGSCVDTCPEGTYLNTATSECRLCSIVCQATGSTSPQCTGPGTHLGAGGCTQCSTGVYDSTGKLKNCVSQCPAATTYSTGVITTDGVQECRYCNTQCAGGCHGPAATECTLCKNNFRTVSGSKLRQCVQSCDAAQDYISQHECLSCNMQCSGGCNGSSAMDCTACKTVFQIQDGGKRLCLASCPQKSFSKTVGLLRQCVDECDTGMYNNTDGVCLPCHEQCASSCIASGNSVLSCAGLCKFFAEEGNCVQECGASYRANEETGECVGASNEEPDNVQEQKSASTSGIIAGSVVGGVVVIVLVLMVVFYLMKRANLHADKKVAIELEIAGADNPNYGVPNQMMMDSDMLHAKPAQADPNMARLVLAQENEIIMGKELGEGAFGTVYEGLWAPSDGGTKAKVAVKVLKENTGAASNKEILDEAVVMASMNHPYLVRLLCICMAPRVMLITELMEHGSLLSYLRKRKRTLTGDVLLLFGRQIAEGMEYLESKRMIHRDLAARNVLVAEHRCVKITDFGLARLLDVGSEEFQHDGGKMPVKWLAPECMQARVFTNQTDVWSYGVTMWEVLTFGNAPFKGFKATEIFSMLLNGERLPKPKTSSAELYDTLLQCWGWEPGMRPTFNDLGKRFAAMEKNPPSFAITRADREGRKFISEADFNSTAPELVAIDDDGYERLGPVRNAEKRSSVISASSNADYDNFVAPQGNSFPSRDTLPGAANLAGATAAGYDNMPTVTTVEEVGNETSPYDNPVRVIMSEAEDTENPYDNTGAGQDALGTNGYDNIPASSAMFGSVRNDAQDEDVNSHTGLLDIGGASGDDLSQQGGASDPYLLPNDLTGDASADKLSGLPSDPYLVPGDELVINQTAILASDEANMVMFTNPSGNGYENINGDGLNVE
ncbi:epidermal growth factor receptor-like isoform X2 [Sycon ciliatum]|uniref:epidermal growth factor receptor-like isoform X2 n=1 Tax=Sycon ciliatum TaxID=27933 RepID=UPI0031F6B87E